MGCHRNSLGGVSNCTTAGALTRGNGDCGECLDYAGSTLILPPPRLAHRPHGPARLAREDGGGVEGNVVMWYSGLGRCSRLGRTSFRAGWPGAMMAAPRPPSPASCDS